MNICMLSADYLPNVGGISAHIVGLSEALVSLGCQVDVVRPEILWGLPLYVQEERNGVVVHRMRLPRIPKITMKLYGPVLGRRLRRLARKRNYDILHWHTFLEDAQVAQHSGVTARVFTNHTSMYLELARTEDGQRIAKAILQPAKRVIAPSLELARVTVEMGFPAERVHVIPNGVDTERFHPEIDGSAIRRRFGIPLDAPVFICARRLEKKNGVTFWVRAIPYILEKVERPVHFLFIGDYKRNDQYSDRERVFSELNALPNRSVVTYIGQVPNDEMPAYFAASDVSVLPSLMEATSVAGLEAMACGLPLIGTRVGGLPEIIEDAETGLLVEPASAEALAGAAVLLCTADEKRRDMGTRGRERAIQSFAWHSVAKRTLEVYQMCLTDGNAIPGEKKRL